jgi:hypothetical protein
MLGRFRFSWKWVVLIGLALLVRLVSPFPNFIETFYSSALYPLTSALQRTLTGWLPFSIGDIIYLGFGVWLLRWIILFFKGEDKGGRWKIFSNLIQVILCIYILFNVLWGLNYNRMNPAKHFGLVVADSLGATDLRDLSSLLMERTNQYRPMKIIRESEARRLAKPLFQTEGFPEVSPSSIKASLFGKLGNYMGYSGYYNPFSGEAQLNTAVPDFLIPFVACHEIAHQAGYAKENEANFVGFLAARRSTDSSMLYSSYFSMFLYANGQLRRLDSTAARQNMDRLLPAVKKDIQVYREYLTSYDNPLGDLVDVFYGQFLRMNQQPAGTATYSSVVLWLHAVYLKEKTL